MEEEILSEFSQNSAYSNSFFEEPPHQNNLTDQYLSRQPQVFAASLFDSFLNRTPPTNSQAEKAHLLREQASKLYAHKISALTKSQSRISQLLLSQSTEQHKQLAQLESQCEQIKQQAQCTATLLHRQDTRKVVLQPTAILSSLLLSTLAESHKAFEYASSKLTAPPAQDQRQKLIQTALLQKHLQLAALDVLQDVPKQKRHSATIQQHKESTCDERVVQQKYRNGQLLYTVKGLPQSHQTVTESRQQPFLDDMLQESEFTPSQQLQSRVLDNALVQIVGKCQNLTSPFVYVSAHPTQQKPYVLEPAGDLLNVCYKHSTQQLHRATTHSSPSEYWYVICERQSLRELSQFDKAILLGHKCSAQVWFQQGHLTQWLVRQPQISDLYVQVRAGTQRSLWLVDQEPTPELQKQLCQWPSCLHFAEPHQAQQEDKRPSKYQTKRISRLECGLDIELSQSEYFSVTKRLKQKQDKAKATVVPVLARQSTINSIQSLDVDQPPKSPRFEYCVSHQDFCQWMRDHHAIQIVPPPVASHYYKSLFNKPHSQVILSEQFDITLQKLFAQAITVNKITVQPPVLGLIDELHQMPQKLNNVQPFLTWMVKFIEILMSSRLQAKNSQFKTICLHFTKQLQPLIRNLQQVQANETFINAELQRWNKPLSHQRRQYMIENMQGLYQIIHSRDIIGKFTQFQYYLDQLNSHPQEDDSAKQFGAKKYTTAKPLPAPSQSAQPSSMMGVRKITTAFDQKQSLPLRPPQSANGPRLPLDDLRVGRSTLDKLSQIYGTRTKVMVQRESIDRSSQQQQSASAINFYTNPEKPQSSFTDLLSTQYNFPSKPETNMRNTTTAQFQSVQTIDQLHPLVKMKRASSAKKQVTSHGGIPGFNSAGHKKGDSVVVMGAKSVINTPLAQSSAKHQMASTAGFQHQKQRYLANQKPAKQPLPSAQHSYSLSGQLSKTRLASANIYRSKMRLQPSHQQQQQQQTPIHQRPPALSQLKISEPVLHPHQ